MGMNSGARAANRVHRAALSATLICWSMPSLAQVRGDGNEPAAAPSPVTADAENSSSSQALPPESTDGTRFRFGVTAGGGLMLWNGYTFNYGGVDLRFGAQINDELAIYAQPQLGVYVETIDGITGTGGLLGTSFLAEYTFIDRIFVGAGPGFAVLNSPSGFELHLRAGGYPIMSKSSQKSRRKGMMLGLDFRLHFVQGATFVAPTFNIGYEAF